MLANVVTDRGSPLGEFKMVGIGVQEVLVAVKQGAEHELLHIRYHEHDGCHHAHETDRLRSRVVESLNLRSRGGIR